MEEGLYAECESCGANIPGHHVLHGSTQIAQIEAAGPVSAGDLDESELEATRQCPHCGRVMGSTSQICPRCERRLN